MSEQPNPKGWEELQALPSRAAPDNRLVVDLRHPNSLAYLVCVRTAPDGQYELRKSGKLLVQGGKLTQVLGIPGAIASMLPSL